MAKEIQETLREVAETIGELIDDATTMTVDQIHDRLVAVKGGVPQKVVFIGIGGSKTCLGAYGEAQEARNLHALTTRFGDDDRGHWVDLCDGLMEDYLEEAFEIIEGACVTMP